MSVSTDPTAAEPLIVGGVVLTGAADDPDWIAAVLSAPASAKPDPFVPATCPLTYAPRSAEVAT